MTSQPEVIAIDGPSASGKSTVARGVANALHYAYVDSGALYRAVTWQALRQGLTTFTEDTLTALLADMPIAFALEGGAVVFSIGGEVPGDALRGPAVTENVSPVSALPVVRRQVVAWLRSMIQFGPLVMEGRDIGTAVFPDAVHKFYLNASAEERARRRHLEMVGKGMAGSASEQEIQASLARRDTIDSTRAIDPLKVAEDAMVIDSTGLMAEDVIARVVQTVSGKTAT